MHAFRVTVFALVLLSLGLTARGSSTLAAEQPSEFVSAKDTLSSSGDSFPVRVRGMASLRIQTLDTYSGTWEVQCSVDGGNTYDTDDEVNLSLEGASSAAVQSVTDTVGIWTASVAGCSDIKIVATAGFAATDTTIAVAAVATGGSSGGGGGGSGDASLAEQETQTTHLAAIETAVEAVEVATEATQALLEVAGSPLMIISDNSDNEDEHAVCTADCTIYSITAFNHTAASAFLRCENDTAGNTTPGSETASANEFDLEIPASTTGAGFHLSFGVGISYSTALTCWIVSDEAATGTTDVAVNDVRVLWNRVQ